MRLFSSSSRPLAVAALFASILPSNALHFYMDPHTPKCFFEELPHETVIVGDYETFQYNSQSRTYVPAQSDLQILITIDELFDNDHRVMDGRRAAKGHFTFTAHDSGEHRICFSTLGGPSSGGWLYGGLPAGGIKFSLDMTMGDTSELERGDKGKLDDMVEKVRDLNGRLETVRREQVFQREREAEFRDQSEATNAKVVRWTLIQLVVLGITCAWQLSHLRAFFIKQKLT